MRSLQRIGTLQGGLCQQLLSPDLWALHPVLATAQPTTGTTCAANAAAATRAARAARASLALTAAVTAPTLAPLEAATPS